MNNQNQIKGISTPVGILIILFCVLLAGGILAWQYLVMQKEEISRPEEEIISLEGGSISPSTETPVKLPVGIIDCETDLDCFIEASKECNPAKVIYTTSIPIFGITKATSYLEIQGMEESKCMLYLKTGEIRLTSQLPPGYPEDIAEKMKRANKKLEGKDGICKFKTNNLVSVLEKWKEWKEGEGSFYFSTEAEGIEMAEECSGEMFEWYRQRVKTYSSYDAQALMRELLIKDNPEILDPDKFLGPEYYRIFEYNRSPHSDKEAILFGLDSEKTKGCCSKPTGLFIVVRGKLGNNYKILKGALEHQYLANVIWDDENLISYNVVTIDEGGKVYKEEYLKAE